MGSGADALRAKVGGNIRESIGAAGLGTARPGPPPARTQPWYEQGVTRSHKALVIDIDRIMPDPDQPRKHFDPEAIEEMRISLLTFEQTTPIECRPSEKHQKWIIVSGERRYRGALAAGLATLKVERKDLTDTTDIRMRQLIENLVRRDLKPIEAANSYQELIEINGWTVSQLARELGISQVRVTQALAVLKADASVRQAVEEGTIVAATAYEISKAPPDDQPAIVRAVVAAGLSRDETREKVREVATRRDDDADDSPQPSKRGRKVGAAAKGKGSAGRPLRWTQKGDGLVLTVEGKGSPAEALALLRRGVEIYELKHPDLAAT